MLEYHVELRLAGHILFAAVLGALIGLERERHVGLAGIRTHAAVAVGACLFGFISMNVAPPSFLGTVSGTADPSRISAQIVSGIGFLGAGVILRDKGQIRGLTTAATLWATASMGLAVANKLYILAVSVTLIILALLSLYKVPGFMKWKNKNRKRICDDD
ncbi:MAG: MgtC/SapB family protein [Chlamydiales bacterium]|nr:MgtC/SapB family protein [Chlamydiales bacterium]